MNNILTIFRKESAGLFNSPIAYVVLGMFLVGTGMFMWVFEFGFLFTDPNVFVTGFANLDNLFGSGPLLFLLLIPALTMRAFSDEFRSGTIEFLATKPLTDWQIITGKYLAVLLLVGLCLLVSMVNYAAVHALSTPEGCFFCASDVDHGATWGAYLGLFGVGAIFAAIGMFTSALTSNQIIAFVLGAALCAFFYLALELMAGIKVLNDINTFLLSFSILSHYDSIARGVIDTRDVLYFLSFVVIGLLGTRMALAGQKR
ncbi:MAG: gliding motility-associated ABC transporter permease subunit GldF [Bacteroidetes bacterium]|nr:MAG: gliding motility-associated ABC transporter permease subunit GldF [Bacteroidota bacterium]